MSKLSSTELSSYERAQRDYWDLTNTFNSAERRGIKKGIEKGLAKGRAEGITKGIVQNKLETAHNLKKEGLPIEMISRVTGLSIEEIENA